LPGSAWPAQSMASSALILRSGAPPRRREAGGGGHYAIVRHGDHTHLAYVQRKARGLEPALFSGHSLRAGFITSAAKRGASVFKMKARPCLRFES
jgi:hypothetical protein